LLNEGANIKVISTLLGHSSLRFTKKYVRAVDEEKKKAINSLPSIEF
jgi:site-specific recombinase XerD